MENFWEYRNWGFISIIAVLLMSLLVANALKRRVKFIKASLIPTSVLGGTILLVISTVYNLITDDVLFDTAFFGGGGMAYLEMITYHTLALGFIAATLKTTKTHLNKKRTKEIFNTGVTTVSTYLLQGTLGLAVTIIAGFFIKDFFSGSGLLIAFGFGQGTGQAMSYGMIYEEQGFVGGKSFGLTIAAIGFLVASFGGVIHMNVLKRTGKLIKHSDKLEDIDMNEVQAPNDIPMTESVDKITIQLALIMMTYFITYGAMALLGNLLPGMKSLIYGFNFLLGVLLATVVKLSMNFMRKRDILHHDYANNFLLTRLSNFFFDIMVVSGIAAIRLDLVKNYIGILIIVCVVGAAATYLYNRFVAKKFFSRYSEEQFMAMYGMLTGTASTGIILLREIDSEFKSPAADNLVYQNFPAIVFGFPLMFLANWCPQNPVAVLFILLAFFVFMNIILFRDFIFKNKRIAHIITALRKQQKSDGGSEE